MHRSEDKMKVTPGGPERGEKPLSTIPALFMKRGCHGFQSSVLRQLKNRREGYSLEQPFYIDQDYFKLDMEMIWYRDWLFVGHDCEIPKAGNYVTVQIGDYPVVIVRWA